MFRVMITYLDLDMITCHIPGQGLHRESNFTSLHGFHKDVDAFGFTRGIGSILSGEPGPGGRHGDNANGLHVRGKGDQLKFNMPQSCLNDS